MLVGLNIQGRMWRYFINTGRLATELILCPQGLGQFLISHAAAVPDSGATMEYSLPLSDFMRARRKSASVGKL